MNISFEDQNIIVTGASRGIGLATAKAFLDSSASFVLLTGTKEQASPELLSVLEPYGDRAAYHCLDFLGSDISEQIDQIITKYSDFDVCVNNAGINKVETLLELNEENLRDVLEVNLVGPALLTSKLVKSMQKKGYGRIVNIASIFGQVTRSGRMNYSSSKFGLIGQTKSTALDMAKDNILINAVAPGFIETELTRKTLGENGIAEMMKVVPLGRLGKPEEIATGVLFLASKNNTFITAETLTIDGGFLAT